MLQTCRRVGTKRDTVYQWLERDPVFAKDFEAANQEVTEKLELAALVRAVNGYKEPVFQGGKQVGEVTRYSDRLLELLLKARDHKKFSERIEYNVDEEVISATIATKFVSIVRRVAPDICPACKTHLNLSTKIAEELLQLSAKMPPDKLKT